MLLLITDCPLINLKKITKGYSIDGKYTEVLKSVSLFVKEGEMIAIVGASGSGKSTLMNLIGLLDKADEGNYQLDGQQVADITEDELANLRNQMIGFVFQQFNLLPRFNAEQNVALPLTYRRLNAHLIKQKVMSALDRVGMKPYAHHRPSQLSGGQQQRIAIARALVTKPRVILADEPTGALDSQTGKEIMDLFLELNQEGKTLILVTHDEQIATQCKRRILIADGQIVENKA